MQKITNAITVGVVHTPYLYKISVQVKGTRLENNKVIKMIKIDEAKTFEKVVGF